jgi:GT2 family glycosyltransferase
MVTICVPCQDNVSALFAQSLANLTARLTKDGIKYHLYFLMGTVLPDNRTVLAQDAIKNGSEYILWLDSDMTFPDDVFIKLYNHKKDIVSATYSTRKKPLRSVAFIDQFDSESRLTETTGLHPVYAVGMGCMLVKTDVFKKLPEPWFSLQWVTEEKRFVGEDVFFCDLAHNAGYEIFVDVDLSNQIAHHGSKLYLLKDTHEYNNKI